MGSMLLIRKDILQAQGRDWMDYQTPQRRFACRLVRYPESAAKRGRSALLGLVLNVLDTA